MGSSSPACAWPSAAVRRKGQRVGPCDLGATIASTAISESLAAARASGRTLWLPYVEVADITEATERARLLGAAVLLGPREGPVGWRSVLAAAAGAEIALWQPKL